MIIRAPRPKSGYMVLNNELVRDQRVSRRARGLLVEMLSYPDNWRITVDSLVEEGIEGRDAVRTALKELEQVGYLTRTKVQDERGRWSTVTVVSEQVPGESMPPKTDFQASDNQASDNQENYPQKVDFQEPTPGKPTYGNPSPGEPGAKREVPRRKTVKSGLARARDMPLPENWSPHEGHRKTAERRGLDLEDEIARFRLFAVERGRLAQDWNAAFERWLLDSRPRPKVTVDAGTYVPGWG